MPNTELEIEKIDPSSSNMNKSLRLVGRDDFIVAEAHEMLASSFKTALLHISTKRIQAEEFEKNKADSTMQTLQIGYAMAYQCMYQHEVSRALWFRESIHLFICALTHTGLKTTMVICTDYKSKDKFSNRTFLEYLYDNIIPKNDEVKEEIIWSDGPTSQFKNKYLCYLMNRFSTKYIKSILWKFSATSHGKGVVDGIGGNDKSIVQSQSMGKRKDKIIVQDTKSFYQVASKALRHG